MAEMYFMAIGMHMLFSIVIVVVLAGNIVALWKIEDLQKYKRVLSVFLTPLTETTFAFVVFTGLVMMVTKYFEFNVQNVVMVCVAVVYIVLEVMRLAKVKQLLNKDNAGFREYKDIALKILFAEIVLLGGVIVWMWIER